MLWKEQLGNPYDDARFLQTIERHRGGSPVNTKREMHISGISQKDKIEDEINDFFHRLHSTGVYLPKDTEVTFKTVLKQVYKVLVDNQFTFYGRTSVKDELLSFLTWHLAPPEIFPQFDDNLSEEDFKFLSKGFEIMFRKRMKKRGLPFSLLPLDKHGFYAHFDHFKIISLFKAGTDLNTIMKMWYEEGMPELLKTLDKLFFEANEQYEKGINKGINFDWLYMLSHINTIKKIGYKKLLKSDKEIAAILGIPYGTYRRKTTFLYTLI